MSTPTENWFNCSDADHDNDDIDIKVSLLHVNKPTLVHNVTNQSQDQNVTNLRTSSCCRCFSAVLAMLFCFSFGLLCGMVVIARWLVPTYSNSVTDRWQPLIITRSLSANFSVPTLLDPYAGVLVSLHHWSGLELMTTTAVEVFAELTQRVANGTLDANHLRATRLNLRALETCPEFANHDMPASCWDEKHYQQWCERSDRVLSLLQVRDRLVSSSGLSNNVLSSSSSTPPVSLRNIMLMVVSGAINHRARVHSVMATWGARFPESNVRVITDSDDQLNSNNASDATTRVLSNCTITLRPKTFPLLPVSSNGCPMNYDESQAKWLLGWDAVFKLSDLDGRHLWYLTMDDDAYLSATNILELVRDLDPLEPWIIGNICTYAAPRSRLCGGAGWLFSVGAARVIRPTLFECQYYIDPTLPTVARQTWSDLFIGLCWRDKFGDKLRWLHTDTFTNKLLDTQYPMSSTKPPHTRIATFHEAKQWKQQVGLFNREKMYEPYSTHAFLDQLHQQLVNLVVLESAINQSTSQTIEESSNSSWMELLKKGLLAIR